MDAPSGTRQWLRHAGIRPRRAWGQNFLINERVAERIVAAWALTPETAVIEIGAGAGSLTLPLLRRGLSVVAIERDAGLCALLHARVAEENPGARLRIVEADILTLGPGAVLTSFSPEQGWVLLGNLPYAQTTPILLWAGAQRDAFHWTAFMVQREYGERLLARPGEAAYGALTLWARSRYDITREALVGPANFWPAPKVESIVLRFTPCSAPRIAGEELSQLERVVRAAFSQRRKMLPQPLAQGLALPRERVEKALRACGIDPRRRAETCDLGEFLALTRALAADL
jgi:16S rRNA (adenine1518-N6/adenine1519-N6)-dimethyltransferase